MAHNQPELAQADLRVNSPQMEACIWWNRELFALTGAHADIEQAAAAVSANILSRVEGVKHLTDSRVSFEFCYSLFWITGMCGLSQLANMMLF